VDLPVKVIPNFVGFVTIKTCDSLLMEVASVDQVSSCVPLCKHTLLSCSEHKDSSEKKHKDKEKTKHKDGSSEKHKDKHKDKDKEKRKEEKVGVSCGEAKRIVLVYTTEWYKLSGLDAAHTSKFLSTWRELSQR